MTIEEVINNPEILKEEVLAENALHFYCPKEDGNFTFVYQYDGKVYPFTSKLPKEQNADIENLKKQFEEFAKAIYIAIDYDRVEKLAEEAEREDIRLSE